MDANGAVALFKGAVETVLAIPLGGPYDAIVQSQSLRANNKNPEATVHVQVARNIEARALGSAPNVGDRVYYIIGEFGGCSFPCRLLECNCGVFFYALLLSSGIA